MNQALKLAFGLLLRLWGNPAYAQAYEAEASHHHVALNDTIEVVFTFSSEGNEIDVYHEADLGRFKVAGGPSQRSRSSFMTEDGKTSMFKEVSVTYKLCSDTPGLFTIPSARLTTKGGKECKTKPITIEVSPSPFKKEMSLILDKDASDLF